MTSEKNDTGKAMMSILTADALLLERVVVGGDLSKLTAEERMRYYAATCESVGLNPMTRPFEYLFLQGKMTLYARKDATEQLRRIHGVSITKLERQLVHDTNEDFYEVTAYAVDSKGRTDSAIGVVYLSGLHGEQRANAMMKAETKAKRRVTLSLCGLGVLDESEIEIPPGAVRATEVVAVAGTLPASSGIAMSREATEMNEVKTLFPQPEADRAGLIQRAKVGVARIEKSRAVQLKAEKRPQ